MGRTKTSTEGLIEFATSQWTLPGEPESGDRHAVVPTDSGVLIAVIDGLGHGAEAAEASQMAVGVLEGHSRESLVALIQHCHQAMKATRGAVMSLAFLDSRENTLTWLGVGNVCGILVHTGDTAAAPENIPMRGGVVGYQLPPLRAVVLPIVPRDLLIFATDGIRVDFDKDLRLDAPSEQIASRICTRYSKGTDDALVLVARYLGTHHGGAHCK